MHCDLNAFYATAEELKDPAIRGKPVIVGGLTSRSVVSTCNYEARKYGVHSGMPTAEARIKCPQGIFRFPDFKYYEVLSRSFFFYLMRFSKTIERVSVDECYLDLTKETKGLKDVVPYLKAIQDGVLGELGLKCSIGVGPTKFLAKMASDYKKPMGITIIRKRDIPHVLYPLGIEDFWGIGKKTAPRLKAMGIKTIGDLAKRLEKGDEELTEALGKMGQTAKLWLEGNGDDVVDVSPFDPKSIGRTETFPSDTSVYEEVAQKFRELARDVSNAALSEHKKGRTIRIVVKDSQFQTHSKSVSFKEATNDFEFIYQKALSLYEKSFLGMLSRLVGVTLENLVNPKEETVQMSFWNYEEYERMDETRLLVNRLNREKGKGTFKLLRDIRKKNGH